MVAIDDDEPHVVYLQVTGYMAGGEYVDANGNLNNSYEFITEQASLETGELFDETTDSAAAYWQLKWLSVLVKRLRARSAGLAFSCEDPLCVDECRGAGLRFLVLSLSRFVDKQR